MDKMNEAIIVFEKKHIFDNGNIQFQGVLPIEESKDIVDRFDQFHIARRGAAETNKDWKQPIPYLLIRRGDEYLVYERLLGGGEERLHTKLSMGIGGHMNNVLNAYSWEELLTVNLYRELEEEVDIAHTSDKLELPKFETIGLINDDSDEVGQVHIGILTSMHIPLDSEVYIKEKDQIRAFWRTLEEIKEDKNIMSDLESWSKLALLTI